MAYASSLSFQDLTFSECKLTFNAAPRLISIPIAMASHGNQQSTDRR